MPVTSKHDVQANNEIIKIHIEIFKRQIQMATTFFLLKSDCGSSPLKHETELHQWAVQIKNEDESYGYD